MDVWACFLHHAYVFLRMCPQHTTVVVFQVWICGPVILSLHDLGSIEVAILKLHSKTYLYAIASSIELQKSGVGHSPLWPQWSSYLRQFTLYAPYIKISTQLTPWTIPICPVHPLMIFSPFCYSLYRLYIGLWVNRWDF